MGNGTSKFDGPGSKTGPEDVVEPGSLRLQRAENLPEIDLEDMRKKVDGFNNAIPQVLSFIPNGLKSYNSQLLTGKLRPIQAKASFLLAHLSTDISAVELEQVMADLVVLTDLVGQTLVSFLDEASPYYSKKDRKMIFPKYLRGARFELNKVFKNYLYPLLNPIKEAGAQTYVLDVLDYESLERKIAADLGLEIDPNNDPEIHHWEDLSPPGLEDLDEESWAFPNHVYQPTGNTPGLIELANYLEQMESWERPLRSTQLPPDYNTERTESYLLVDPSSLSSAMNDDEDNTGDFGHHDFFPEGVLVSGEALDPDILETDDDLGAGISADSLSFEPVVVNGDPAYSGEGSVADDSFQVDDFEERELEDEPAEKPQITPPQPNSRPQIVPIDGIDGHGYMLTVPRTALPIDIDGEIPPSEAPTILPTREFAMEASGPPPDLPNVWEDDDAPIEIRKTGMSTRNKVLVVVGAAAVVLVSIWAADKIKDLIPDIQINIPVPVLVDADDADIVIPVPFLGGPPAVVTPPTDELPIVTSAAPAKHVEAQPDAPSTERPPAELPPATATAESQAELTPGPGNWPWNILKNRVQTEYGNPETGELSPEGHRVLAQMSHEMLTQTRTETTLIKDANLPYTSPTYLAQVAPMLEQWGGFGDELELIGEGTTLLQLMNELSGEQSQDLETALASTRLKHVPSDEAPLQFMMELAKTMPIPGGEIPVTPTTPLAPDVAPDAVPDSSPNESPLDESPLEDTANPEGFGSLQIGPHDTPDPPARLLRQFESPMAATEPYYPPPRDPFRPEKRDPFKPFEGIQLPKDPTDVPEAGHVKPVEIGAITPETVGPPKEDFIDKI
ncbi:hypothetical protein HN680_00720, partial [Candidatus Peregrinibacteria bacterium]|nr:hypothetical protein [Candidatus Peregrinibacteria bacterium]